jgi:hypothetical protein
MAEKNYTAEAIADLLIEQIDTMANKISKELAKELARSLGKEATRLWINATWKRILNQMKGGLISHVLLESVEIKEFTGSHSPSKISNAYDANDTDFMNWYIKQLGGVSNQNRLRLRMFLCAALEDVEGLRGMYWEGEDD